MMHGQVQSVGYAVTGDNFIIPQQIYERPLLLERVSDSFQMKTQHNMVLAEYRSEPNSV